MRLRALLVLFIFFVIASWAWGAPPDVMNSLASQLDSWEVERAWTEVKELLLKEPNNPELLELASHIAFHRGDYQEALKLIKSAMDLGAEEEKTKGLALFIEETIGAIAPFKRYESSHFIISLDENRDGILVGYLLDSLEKTYQIMAQQYGFQPKEKIRIEVFPDTKAFYYASTLSARDIEVTGAVGLAKFNKLMVLSPKALVYGYRWLDAISHEYMHYLILKLTSNKAPIWFHEGLAKYEETHWRSGPSYLSALYQTLLARALAEKRLIGFERMEPSLVRLETPEDVQLAYAQAASAIEFIIEKIGHDGLKQIMGRMANDSHRGASDPIKEVMGLSFPEFESSWREFLALRGFKEVEGVNVRRYKIKEGRADEERLDMGEIKSLVARNRAHLGDLLKERGRMEAAVSEYRRALTDARDSVPIINRLSDVLILQSRHEEALDLLKRSKDISSDHPTPYTNMGQIYLKLKDFTKAKAAFEESIQINPFNPEVHRGLAIVYETLGDKASALRETEMTKRLER